MKLSWDKRGILTLEERPTYDPSDVELDSSSGTWQGAVLFVNCEHRWLRGWWHRLTGRTAHIVAYLHA